MHSSKQDVSIRSLSQSSGNPAEKEVERVQGTGQMEDTRKTEPSKSTEQKSFEVAE